MVNIRRLLLVVALASPSFAAVGDITAIRVHGGVVGTCTAGAAACNGWVAEIDISGLATGGSYAFGLTSAASSLATAKGTITCTSLGYDTTGNATTISRTVYMTHALRKPTPNQAVNDETAVTITVRVSLSDYIYASDASCTANVLSGLYTASAVPNNPVSGLAVTNNSTRAYPASIGRWAWPQYEQVTNDFLLEAVIFNRFARNAKPMAAVKFTCTDAHVHTVTQTVTGMTVSGRVGDANHVLVYAATMPVATLTQGDVLTCNFQGYPWVGDSGSIVDSSAGTAPPDERLGPFKLLNDKSGTYGAAYVAVKSTGNNATCAAVAVQATAESAAGCLDIGTAITKLKAFNNTTYTRNNPGGGVVLMFNGNYTYPGTQPGVDQGAQDTWVTIRPASTATQAGVVINNGTNADIETQRIKITGITIDTHVASPVATLTGRTATDVLWLDNDIFNMTDTAPIWTWKLVYATQNSITQLANGFTAFSTTPSPYALVRGNTVPSASAGSVIVAHMYCSIGNKNIIIGDDDTGWIKSGSLSTQQPTDNSIYAFNSVYNANARLGQLLLNSTWTKGTAIIQNVLEKVTDIDELIVLSADGNVATSDNLLVWHNTFVGQRVNGAYNEVGASALFHTNYSFIGNIAFNQNIKTDTFPTANAARVGNWGPDYGVGYRANSLQGVNNGTFFAPDYEGLYTFITVQTIGFTSDKSFATGNAAGNGDYRLTASSAFKGIIPAGAAVLPFDFTGTPRRNLGSGAIGAYEFGTDPPPVGTLCTLSTLKVGC